MGQALVHEELSLSWPDGFQVMTANELKQLYLSNNPKRWGIWDKERHVMITVLWQEYHPLLNFLADPKAMAKRNEQLTRRGYKKHDYRLESFLSMQFCGRNLEGYCFSYRLGDTAQRVETLLLKQKKCVYNFSCIGRKENEEKDRALFREVMNTLNIL